LRQAIDELTAGLASPSVFSRKRALSIRSSVHYNLGDLEACERDNAEERALVRSDAERDADPRATGGELYQ
jgi:hypothetical protein